MPARATISFSRMPGFQCLDDVLVDAVHHGRGLGEQHDLVAEAARMLLDCIDEPERPARSLLLPVSLIVRGSTASPPGT